MARSTWPRLSEYFARFRLSLGLICSLEVLAPTLSRLPLRVLPVSETADDMESVRQDDSLADDDDDDNDKPRSSSSKRCRMTKKNNV
jgi:hypothetical protein